MMDLIAGRLAVLQSRRMTMPLIDATTLTPAVRHPRIFEMFDALSMGESFVLENDHYPLPLLYQFQVERPNQFEWSVLSPGPRFRVQITRRDPLRPHGTREYLTWDHARLDALFDDVIHLVEQASFDEARERFAPFAYGLARHIAFEETLLFPIFEARAGGSGPVPVMRVEHEEIQESLRAMAAALAKRDAVAFSGAVATLVLGEHNIKEEQVLYPVFDELVPDAERVALVHRMQLTPP